METIETPLSLLDVLLSPGHLEDPPIVVNTGVPKAESSVMRTANKSPMKSIRRKSE